MQPQILIIIWLFDGLLLQQITLRDVTINRCNSIGLSFMKLQVKKTTDL